MADGYTMLIHGGSARSVVNRAYYTTFYSILALLIALGVAHKTSKHSGIISIFDSEFVRSGKLDKEYSKIVHRLFDGRQELDYKEFSTVTKEEAGEALHMAERFLAAIKIHLGAL